MRSIEKLFVFLSGLLILFDFLIGGQTAGATAVGGYGYRASDFVCVAGILLLATCAYNSARILSIYVFVGVILVAFAPAALFRSDYSATIAARYILYSLSGLMLAILLSKEGNMRLFCFGLIAGLLCSVGVFALQNTNVSRSQLLSWGLIAGYAEDFWGYQRQDAPRYSGLWGHPNEAGHISAIAAVAGAYLYRVEGRIAPLVLTAGGLLGVFYYTLSRGGLIAACVPILVALVVPKEGKVLDVRFLVSLVLAASLLLVFSQFDLLTARFSGDVTLQGNFLERLDSILGGLQVFALHPTGLPIESFLAELGTYTGGVLSPHNGFIFMGAIFGILPFAMMAWALIVNFKMTSNTDQFFVYLSLQTCVSFNFEQLPGAIPFIFTLSLMMARAFLKSALGVAMRPVPKH